MDAKAESNAAGSTTSASNAAKPKKRFVGQSTAGSSSTRRSAPAPPSYLAHQIPSEIIDDPLLNAAIKQLPANYSFEIHKTIHHIRKHASTMVALQMPEGLLMFACTIADIIEKFTSALTVIMGDVTYGACCIDDYTALALGCDMLVHYGHSCLVPVDTTKIKTLYVFVEIGVDAPHLIQTIRHNFPASRAAFHELLLDDEEARSQVAPGEVLSAATAQLRIEASSDDSGQSSKGKQATLTEPTRLSLISTIQFVSAVHALKEDLLGERAEPTPTTPVGLLSSSSVSDEFTQDNQKAVVLADVSTSVPIYTGKYEVTVPQSRPLSPGEILGCTAPRLTNVDALLYVGDGRFHLESIMIANPTIPAFRYDPYSKKLTRERYGHQEMRALRGDAVQKARGTIGNGEGLADAPSWGVVLGTLGRQGNFKQLQSIIYRLQTAPKPIPYVPILLSELSPAKLALFGSHISTFIQTSCPRLSIDWGYAFPRPLLSPYESAVAVAGAKGWEGDGMGGEGTYPMDFYAAGSMAALQRQKGAQYWTEVQ